MNFKLVIEGCDGKIIKKNSVSTAIKSNNKGNRSYKFNIEAVFPTQEHLHLALEKIKAEMSHFPVKNEEVSYKDKNVTVEITVVYDAA